MKIFGFSKFKLINPNIKALAIPFVSILILFVLFLALFQNGYTRISLQIRELKETIKNENTLEEKVEILREVKKALGSSEKVVIALPYHNSGLWLISQLKASASKNMVGVAGVELINETKENDLIKMQLNFEAQASESATLVTFVKSIKTLAPVTTIDGMTLGEKMEGNIGAEIKLSVFWSDLPKKLPPIDAPVKQLSSDEMALLAKISNLTSPQFTTLSPKEPIQRENPFD